MLRARRAGIESFLALGILAAGMTGTTSCSGRSTDARTLLEVQDRLRSDGRLAMSRFQVIDADGVITLSGFVNTTEQRKARGARCAAGSGRRDCGRQPEIERPQSPGYYGFRTNGRHAGTRPGAATEP
jgi:hypothetical protein